MGKQRKKEELNIPVMILCIIGTVLVVFGILLLKNENFKLTIKCNNHVYIERKKLCAIKMILIILKK